MTICVNQEKILIIIKVCLHGTKKNHTIYACNIAKKCYNYYSLLNLIHLK